MLVNAQIVARPGDNGTPPGGACMLTGDSHPDHGPYASALRGYFSKAAVADLARQFGLLLTEEAQGVYDALLNDAAVLRASVAKLTDRIVELETEQAELNVSIEAGAERERLLEETLAKTKSAADIAREYLVVETAKAKKASK